MRPLVVSLLLILSVRARAESDLLAKIEHAETKLFDDAAPSVVFISSHDAFGSGFFVGPGLILTAAHVVPNDHPEVVLFDGRRLGGRVVERANGVDLALVELEVAVRTPLPPPLPLELKAPRVGGFVAAIGHGRGGIWSFNIGIVSNLYPTASDSGVFQTQIPLYPGASGGPILDAEGRVVGLVTSGLTDSPGINFALRMDLAPRVLRRLGKIVPVLTVSAPAGGKVFVDGVLVGVGPRTTLLPSNGEHDVSLVVPGQGISHRRVRFPAEREVDLTRR